MNGWGVFAASFISTIGAVALLGFILKSWLQTRLAESIRAEYARQQANESHQREIRMKAALIGELLAEWLSKKEDRTKLNQLTFEAFIWLPKDIAIDLSNLLSHNENRTSTRDVLGRVRKLLLPNDDLDHQKIIVFKRTATSGD